MTSEEREARLAAIVAQLLPCPFCGMKLPVDDDTIYPTTSPQHRTWYGVYRYGIFCNEVFSGCGAEIHGAGATVDDALSAAIAAWNMRAGSAR